ncbi:uncharacterized protein DSM5745_07186 [Aspergillus mulundensis]|uniref:SMP domain-containing protein n=1 Tax=Aspergillus mulundensis TaxID=1810919 RepID=A0A3D8RKU0_9EURO|nr:Uncharacterized protein DSM5745_07186 [Aspergillus mulundensis]RDW74524.1 Uncharacterized protein DSM5745_07186 [Aspergillus mulundensis]
MSSSDTEFPSIADLKHAVESGQRITPEDVSVIGQLERELSGSTGPMQETAQALVAGQMDFDAKLDELAVKPRSHITMQDAQEIEDMETRAFNKAPGPGSIANQVRSIADRNEVMGLPPVSADAPIAFVTKDDAREAQHAEATIYGGQNPKGGMAAHMQSAADKLERARRDG